MGGGGGEPEIDTVGKGRRTYGHDEGVAETRDGVGDLVAELDVVVVEPAAVDFGDSVEAGHALLCEEAGEQVADDTADSMGGEDLVSERSSVSTPVQASTCKVKWANAHRDSHRSRTGT